MEFLHLDDLDENISGIGTLQLVGQAVSPASQTYA
jgi:hypothetical protein